MHMYILSYILMYIESMTAYLDATTGPLSAGVDAPHFNGTGLIPT